jgi:hypothetical protein
MSRFTVFAEREAFNDITFNGDYPNLKSIFSEHSTIYLNMSPEDLAQEQQQKVRYSFSYMLMLELNHPKVIRHNLKTFMMILYILFLLQEVCTF